MEDASSDEKKQIREFEHIQQLITSFREFAENSTREELISLIQGHEELTGQAKLTPAYDLPCDYVLHTVGPIICGRVTQSDRELLGSCYRSCLELAQQNGIGSVAFCCISTGEFHFPNEEAAKIAVDTVREYRRNTEVVFNVFKDVDYEIYRELLG